MGVIRNSQVISASAVARSTKMKLQLCVAIIIYVVNSEWVEITPIQNKRYLSDTKKLYQTTSNYESIMKNPFINLDSVTSPTFLSIQENLARDSGNDTVEVYDVTEMPGTVTDYLNVADSSNEKNDADTFEEFLPFLKTIQKNLLQFKKAHKSKLSTLKHLRDRLLFNIRGLIEKLWKPKISLEARGYHEEDSHMDFPSNEGALMTIGFLTFAVFLIKLVIKLIHTLKYKQQYFATTSTTTAASVVFLRRRKREEREEEIAKILQYIEEF